PDTETPSDTSAPASCGILILAGRGTIEAAPPARRWSSASTGTSALPNTTQRGHIVCQVTSTVMTLDGAL
ncbi:MAG TPA: hypothetical protein ACQGQJ_07315, partial [Xylella fastidiosa subsp. multiplex]